MKIMLTVIMILTFASTMLFAQTAIPFKGDKIVGVQLGLDDLGVADIGFLGRIELGATDDILNLDGIPTSLGYGATVGFASSNDDFYDGWSYLMVAGNGYFHIDFLGMENLDTFTKATLGLYRISYDNNLGSDYSNSDFKIDFYLGARYYFSDALAAVVELGSGFGTIHLGVDFKL